MFIEHPSNQSMMEETELREARLSQFLYIKGNSK